MAKKFLFIILLIILVSLGFFILKRPEPAGESKIAQTIDDKPTEIAKNLKIPWSLVFLPNGNALFTEREGKVRLLENENIKTVFEVKDVAAQGEGGLLGIELHPNFNLNRFVYIYYTHQRGGSLENKVVRFKFEDNTFKDEKMIINKIPGNNFHNGGRIKFGPDGNLYIGTGDSQNPSTSQNKGSLAGKILRLKDDGSIPSDNPFNNAVYSFGHRNVQGLAWDKSGRLWATEHGALAFDELNLIEKGKNYGWPEFRGSPVIHSANDTWAPSGLAFLRGRLFFAGLRGQTLYEFDIEKNDLPAQARLLGQAGLKKHFEGKFGRLRDVVVGPLDFLYILTSNRDGRGFPSPSDDRILKIRTR